MSEIKSLSIDLETRSSADLAKGSVYRYTESPDFDILLFGVSINHGPVRVYDLAGGESIPGEILAALKDPGIEKWAYNSSFERICLSVWLRRRYPEFFSAWNPDDDYDHQYLDPGSWRCSMVLGAYNGLPMGLGMIGKVLGLEQQKLKEGRDLIRLFCLPAIPSLINGGGTWNRPEDYPEKWELFKQYNLRDVEVELQIQERLSKYPVPEAVWEEYCLDQMINDRGIRIDRDLVREAIRIDTISKGELTEKLRKLTGMKNPNSVAELKQYLNNHGIEIDTLGKKEARELMKTVPEDLRKVLELRLQIAKSSVKKYQAMEDSVGSDGRCRGMFQFYGANRTGRWCLTGDHEVLTPDGWVRLDSWQGGLIACWTGISEAVSFQPAEQVSFDYKGLMYTYRDGRIDQCSTPDHKMRVMKKTGNAWQDMTVEEMSHCRPLIPLTGTRYHRGCANPAWIRVLIMTQADGYYKADGSVRFHFKKQRKIERCKQLLRRAEIPFTTTQSKDTTILTIPARGVPLWLREFRTKTFGFWILDENPDIFFDELPNWDGYYPAPNSIQYSTCNRQNADIVQALAHMSGRCAIMRIKKRNEKNSQWKDSYVLDIWLTPGSSHEIRNKPEIHDFDGKVYCASTPTGYFLVRRNGKVWITGNSGRIVQMQNLPQNHMEDLDQARSLIRKGDYEMTKMLYPSVPGVLSELIRTAFIPREGNQFIVADFSAIEARALSYLAGEKWRIDLFHNGGDIYCQSASQMFGVPVEKHGVNSHLRQKGKISELACIAEGEKVLTPAGQIPIETVQTRLPVWDGERWVSHGGVVYKGIREVITYDGLTATWDHPVWIMGRKTPVKFGYAAAIGARLIHLELYGLPLEMNQDDLELRSGFECFMKVKPVPVRLARVYDLLDAGPNHRFTVSGKLVHNCGYGGSVGALKSMGALEMGLREEELKPLVDMWRKANPKIEQYWWDVDAAAKAVLREGGRRKVGNLFFEARSGMLFIQLPSGRQLAYVKPRLEPNRFGGESITYMGTDAQKKWARIETYGPKLVENITQAICRDILAFAMKNLAEAGYRIVAHVHDEVIIEAPIDAKVDAVCEIMGRTPAWLPGIELKAEGGSMEWYQKT